MASSTSVREQDVILAGPLTVRIDVDDGVNARLDRLIAEQLCTTRTVVQTWARKGRLTIEPGGARALRRPARRGQVLRFE